MQSEIRSFLESQIAKSRLRKTPWRQVMGQSRKLDCAIPGCLCFAVDPREPAKFQEQNSPPAGRRRRPPPAWRNAIKRMRVSSEGGFMWNCGRRIQVLSVSWLKLDVQPMSASDSGDGAGELFDVEECPTRKNVRRHRWTGCWSRSSVIVQA